MNLENFATMKSPVICVDIEGFLLYNVVWIFLDFNERNYFIYATNRFIL